MDADTKSWSKWGAAGRSYRGMGQGRFEITHPLPAQITHSIEPQFKPPHEYRQHDSEPRVRFCIKHMCWLIRSRSMRAVMFGDECLSDASTNSINTIGSLGTLSSSAGESLPPPANPITALTRAKVR
eukprot:1362688-Amorphochlora_amoeboformis.AAC.1